MRQAVREASGRMLRPRWANRWDAVAFLLLFALLALVGEGARGMHAPLSAIRAAPLSLSPAGLPYYALRSVMRMFLAMAASLIFTFAYATLAAKSRRAELLLIPALDILQSVPVLGFLSFTVVFFLHLFPGSVLGAECASIFAIFTSQAWNMAFSFYQSLKTIPQDLSEVSSSFRFSAWQRFWQLEVPFAMPGLIWNAMMSMSGGWFFVVASEAISIGDQTVTLPGIGSYVGLAIAQRNLHAIFWAIAAMGLVILAYDQLLFRPLVAWAERFRFEQSAAEGSSRSWVLTVLLRTRLLQKALGALGRAGCLLLCLWRAAWRRAGLPRLERLNWPHLRLPFREKTLDAAWIAVILLSGAYGGWRLFSYLSVQLTLADAGQAFALGLATLARVLALIALASLIWVPVGVWIGLKPALAQKVQPLAQFLAAFPANLLFPVAVMGIVRFHLHPDLWLSPLMILGTQWYILFNVIAGASAIPTDFREAAATFQIRGWPWWKTVALPGVMPYYITGALTASGGAWNASIVAELVTWGKTTLAAHGLGAYIAEATLKGDYPRIVLGIAVMSLFVTLLNRLLWRRLYALAAQRYRLG